MVVEDLTNALLNDAFVDVSAASRRGPRCKRAPSLFAYPNPPPLCQELFKPQPCYSMRSTRQIFDKLAHSSIMKLNKTSMDKLYDLMIMNFKFQVTSLRGATGGANGIRGFALNRRVLFRC
jgi:hypothetical protein